MPQTSSDVARLVVLHHRRRGWAWVTVGSAIGVVVYVGIAGMADTVGIVAVFVLLALVLMGLVVMIVDTTRIHRADAAVQTNARGRVSHYPVYAHAHRFPPRHRGSWVFAIFMLAVMSVITVGILPIEVNSWAYVVGAESHDTFNPTSYGQSCFSFHRGGCHPVTDGYLSKSGADVTWGNQVPLGQPFGVRDPLWAWGSGRTLIGGDGSAIGTIIAGLFFDGVTLLFVYVFVLLARGNTRAPVPVGPHPVGQAQHPGRGHHGSGVRRRGGRARSRRLHLVGLDPLRCRC
jgi:hypothetical protein